MSGRAADGGTLPVLRAVDANRSVSEVRRVIVECACGSDERRAAAVNEKYRPGPPHLAHADVADTPLCVAHVLGRGDLVGLLLASGADAGAVVAGGREAASLALAVSHGQVGTLRTLLKKKGYDANARLPYRAGCTPNCSHDDYWCTLAHLAVVPLRRCPDQPLLPPQLECLEILVREGGADVNAPDIARALPLHWLSAQPRRDRDFLAAMSALVRLGADVNGDLSGGGTPIFGYMSKANNLPALRRLLDLGASADVVITAPAFLGGRTGQAPLIFACTASPPAPEIVRLLLRRSSPATRRATITRPGARERGWSAIDALVDALRRLPFERWHLQLTDDLLDTGAPVQHEHLRVLLGIIDRQR
jgi:hypothetical protein